jgi:hypothetical protein
MNSSRVCCPAALFALAHAASVPSSAEVAITQALNQRGIRTASGAKWYASSMMNVLEREKASRQEAALL